MQYFQPDLRRIGLLTLLTAFGIGVGLLQILPMSILIDMMTIQRPLTDVVHRVFAAVLPTNNKVGQIIGITLIGMGLKLAQDVSGLFREMVRRRIDYNGMARVRTDCFLKLQRLSIGPAPRSAPGRHDLPPDHRFQRPARHLRCAVRRHRRRGDLFGRHRHYFSQFKTVDDLCLIGRTGAGRVQRVLRPDHSPAAIDQSRNGTRISPPACSAR